MPSAILAIYFNRLWAGSRLAYSPPWMFKQRYSSLSMGDCAVVRPVAFLAVMAFVFPMCVSGADRADGPAYSTGISQDALSRGERVPSDTETQLREIENTKRLMKELGSMHGGGSMATGKVVSPAAPGPSVPTEASATTPAADSGPNLLANPNVRETVKAVSGVVQQVTGSTPRPVDASARSPGSEAPEPPPRPRQPGDEERLAEMLNGLLDEMLPWAIGFGVLFVVGYGGVSLASARSGGAAQAPASRRRHRSRRSSGSSRGSESSGRRRSRSSQSGHHHSAGDSSHR